MLAKSILLFGICFLFRILYAGVPVISGDEAFTIYYSNLPISDIWKFLLQGNHPPLWEIILHYWVKLVGDDLFAIRSLSVFFSSLMVIPLFLIGERFVKKNVGWIAVSLFICSNFSIYLSHEARAYSLFEFLTVMSFYVYLSIYQESNKKLQFAYILINSLLLYVHYMAVFVWLVQLICFLFFNQSRAKWMLILSCYFCIGFLSIPLLSSFISRVADSGVHGTWITAIDGSGMSELYNMIGRCFNSPVETCLSIVILIWAIFSVFNHKIKNEFTLFSWAGIPHLLIFIYSFYRGFYYDKYLYFTFPAIYVLIGIGIENLNSKIKYFALIALISLQIYDMKLNSSLMKYHGERLRFDLLADINNRDNIGIIFINNMLVERECLYYLDRISFRNCKFEKKDKSPDFQFFKKQSIYIETNEEFLSNNLSKFTLVDTRKEYSLLLSRYDSSSSYLLGNIKMIPFKLKNEFKNTKTNS